MNRKDFQVLSAVRLKEAKALLKSGFPDGAYYLAGYSVEFALKACIAKYTLRHDFPDKKMVMESHTHSLTQLVFVAKLESERLEFYNREPLFQKNWEIVKKWSEANRYQRNSTEMAAILIDAIEDRRYGVITWLKRHY